MRHMTGLVRWSALTGAALWLGAAVVTLGTGRDVAAQAPAAPTFHKDVEPILQKSCQGCHRPGQIGPMSLLSYEAVRPWARAIKAKVVAREMPPWFADPHFNQFANDRRLSDRDVDTIARWVDGGALAGNAADAPAPVQWPADGWEIQPDVSVAGAEIKVPASGVVEWITVTAPTGFTKDTWVTSIEVQPGARAVVHHVCTSFTPHTPGVKYRVPEWRDKPRDEEGVEIASATPAPMPRAPVDTPLNDTAGGGRLHCYVPGIAAVDFRPYEAATLIPAGSDISFSLHYNPNGKEAVDLTKVGFTIAKEPPKRKFITLSLNPPRDRATFAIPPNEPNWQAPTGTAVFNRDVELVSLLYHMHDRGRDAMTRLEYPDGRMETVLRVPKYDFNWQMTYAFAKPTKIPKGTKIIFDAHYGNTVRRGYLNPNKWVYWGDQTWEEMMGNWMGMLIERDVNRDEVMTPLNRSAVTGNGGEG